MAKKKEFARGINHFAVHCPCGENDTLFFRSWNYVGEDGTIYADKEENLNYQYLLCGQCGRCIDRTTLEVKDYDVMFK